MAEKTLLTCAACGQIGKHGANFRIRVDGSVESVRYHKYCAERIAAGAPEGVTAHVVHVAELARERRERDERAVKDFWSNRPRGGQLTKSEQVRRRQVVTTLTGDS